MKTNIRFGVYETNSSLGHSLIIMNKSDYEKFLEHDEDDDWLWDSDLEKWVKKADISEDKRRWRYYESFFNDEHEYEIKEFTTPHGDTVVAISEAYTDW